MSCSDLALSVRGLSKSFTIAHQGGEKHSTLAESLLARVRRPFRRIERETFWALKDVSFDVTRGDVVGIIGRNGAGKSTLLKILSRITEPTTGEVDVYGPIGSLLEVGTGFHPELTGRENIYLNGAILGMNRAEIRKQFDAIVDFAGVERFLDTPVKRYSSGMYVRLAFAVAAHLRSEVLIVDEVLAVGDAEFQKKCLGKMKHVASDGRTVLLVSHDLRTLRNLCDRLLYLCEGRRVQYGPVAPTIERYVGDFETGQLEMPIVAAPLTVTRFTLEQAGQEAAVFDGAEAFHVRLAFELSEKVVLFRIGVYIRTAAGEAVCRAFHTDWDPTLECLPAGAYEAALRVPGRLLMPGSYRVGLHASRYGCDGLICEHGVEREVLLTAPEHYNAAHPSEQWEATLMLSDGWHLAGPHATMIPALAERT